MFPVCLCQVGKFCTVIRLEDLGLVSEIGDCPFDKVHGGITALLHIRVEEPLPGSLINHSILVKLLRDTAGIAGCGDIFHIHLPFHAQSRGSVIWFWLVCFLFGRSMVKITHPAADAVERSRVPCVAFGGQEFSIKFADGNVGISAEVITDPGEFFRRMCIGVAGMGSVGFVAEGFFCAVIPLIPTHERGFRDMIASADKGNADASTVKHNGIVPGFKFMWQISL